MGAEQGEVPLESTVSRESKEFGNGKIQVQFPDGSKDEFDSYQKAIEAMQTFRDQGR